MQIGRLAKPLAYSALALLTLSIPAIEVMAQSHDDHIHPATAQQKPNPQEHALVQAVREATERFRDVTDVSGPGEGYNLMFGCVSGGDFGAMGLHYVNLDLVGDGEITLGKPEIILFEPKPNGGIRITGADYLVDAATWDANPEHKGPPQLMGQLFHFFEAPNRFGLKAFYTLHVWAWKNNPNGTFANWNPTVSCDAFVDTSTAQSIR